MLATAKGYYDGTQIVLDNAVRSSMEAGQEVSVTYYVLNNDDWAEKMRKRKAFLDSKQCVVATGITADVVEAFIRDGRGERNVY